MGSAGIAAGGVVGPGDLNGMQSGAFSNIWSEVSISPLALCLNFHIQLAMR